MVDVEFELTSDDLVAFGDHVYRTSPKLVAYSRQVRTRASAAVGLLTFLAFVVIYANPIGRIVLGLAAAIISWFVFWLAWPRQVRRSYSKSVSGDALGDFGPRRLVVDDDGITESSDGVRLSASWSSLKRFELSPDHAFAWTSATAAFVIPTRIGAESVEGIVAAISEHRPDLS